MPWDCGATWNFYKHSSSVRILKTSWNNANGPQCVCTNWWIKGKKTFLTLGKKEYLDQLIVITSIGDSQIKFCQIKLTSQITPIALSQLYLIIWFQINGLHNSNLKFPFFPTQLFVLPWSKILLLYNLKIWLQET